MAGEYRLAESPSGGPFFLEGEFGENDGGAGNNGDFTREEGNDVVLEIDNRGRGGGSLERDAIIREDKARTKPSIRPVPKAKDRNAVWPPPEIKMRKDIEIGRSVESVDVVRCVGYDTIRRLNIARSVVDAAKDIPGAPGAATGASAAEQSDKKKTEKRDQKKDHGESARRRDQAVKRHEEQQQLNIQQQQQLQQPALQIEDDDVSIQQMQSLENYNFRDEIPNRDERCVVHFRFFITSFHQFQFIPSIHHSRRVV